MYMLVFVTLMVAIIGGYAQIYTKQAAKGVEQQSGAVNSMLAWHSTATALAKNLVTLTSIPSTGCSMLDPGNTQDTWSPNPGFPDTTPGVPSAAVLPTCLYWTSCHCAYTSIYVGARPIPPSGSDYDWNYCSGDQAPPCFVGLPDGYSSAYSFYSVAFNDGLAIPHYFVLTFVPPPPVNSDSYNLGLLCLPGNASGALNGSCPAPHTQFSTTFNDLYKQMKKNPLLSPMYYGTVTAAKTLTTPPLSFVSGATPAPITYIIPDVTTVPVGSIGIISEIPLCPTCHAPP
jgi:hypothetical protein